MFTHRIGERHSSHQTLLCRCWREAKLHYILRFVYSYSTLDPVNYATLVIYNLQ